MYIFLSRLHYMELKVPLHLSAAFQRMRSRRPELACQ